MARGDAKRARARARIEFEDELRYLVGGDGEELRHYMERWWADGLLGMRICVRTLVLAKAGVLDFQHDRRRADVSV